MTFNIKQMDQSAWVCYELPNNSYYYGEVGYLDESGIVHPKESSEASNPKNKLVKHGFGLYLLNVNPDNGTPQSKYQGFWDKDQKSGKGQLTSSDGSTYEGNFHEGHFHGSGKMIWPNGAQYDGNWKRSKMDSSGVFKHSTGFVLKGIFKNNYFIDENILRNPFLSEKQYLIFKKERKQILKQKQKLQKVKLGFSTKINQQNQLKENIQRSVSNNRVPLILSSKTSQFNLESLIGTLQRIYDGTKVNVFDLRKIYSLQKEEKWNYRKQVHESFRNSLKNGEIFLLSLDESGVDFKEMFYPDVKQFYEPNGFNSLSWSRQQLRLPEVRKKIFGSSQKIEISDGFKLLVWTKFKVENGGNESSIRQTLELRFQKIIPFVKMDCLVFTEAAGQQESQ